MAKISVLTTTPLSGYNHIDALLNSSPDWNYFEPEVANTLFYSFGLPTMSTTSATGEVVFTPQQKFYAIQAFAELAKYTGIRFVETSDPAAAQIVLCNADITSSAQTMGLASWRAGYQPLPNGEFTDYNAYGTLYMDNKEFGAQNANLAPGTRGYETMLHELGHLIGLKHPHEANPDNPAMLPAGQDGAYYTVMSYSTFSAPGTTFATYDIAALRWLYGGDGLGGLRGASGGGVYLSGTPFADTLNGTAFSDMFEGNLGDDVINGGAGLDFVNVGVPRYLMTVERTANGYSLGDGSSTDQLVGIERIVYNGGNIALDIDGAGGQAYRLYNAVLGRTPDSAGLGFWLSNLDKGVSLSAVAGAMMGGDEFVANFGSNLTNMQLVQTLYQNILDRPAEQAGVNYWVGALDAGTISQSDALAMISESTENRTSVDPTIANGFMYAPWG
ncbi:MAG TPA: DUF4214 domain-containing protein [Telluria sp.]|nr:DUF4214 domain-containing protein [Telluria sp.]